MQRTRLRRAPTEAVSSQKTFANNASGQTRRAADAIVGREIIEVMTMKVVVAPKYLRLLRREVEQRDIEFENAPIRFVFEALLVEYNSIRREIEMRLEFAERTTNYLLFLVGAVVSVYQIFGC